MTIIWPTIGLNADFLWHILFFTHSTFFSDELRTNIRSEIQQSKIALENAIGLSSDALQQANQVYDEALTLIANINALAVPDINLEKLRTDAIKAISEVFLVHENQP